MERTRRYFLLAIFYAAAGGVGLWLIEEIEGRKIMTSEHIDFEVDMIWIGGIGLFITVVPLFIVPITALLNRYVPLFIIKWVLFTLFSAVLANVLFVYWYRYFDEFPLQSSTAVWIFSLIGSFYVLLNEWLLRREHTG